MARASPMRALRGEIGTHPYRIYKDATPQRFPRRHLRSEALRNLQGGLPEQRNAWGKPNTIPQAQASI